MFAFVANPALHEGDGDFQYNLGGNIQLQLMTIVFLTRNPGVACCSHLLLTVTDLAVASAAKGGGAFGEAMACAAQEVTRVQLEDQMPPAHLCHKEPRGVSQYPGHATELRHSTGLQRVCQQELPIKRRTTQLSFRERIQLRER